MNIGYTNLLCINKVINISYQYQLKLPAYEEFFFYDNRGYLISGFVTDKLGWIIDTMYTCSEERLKPIFSYVRVGSRKNRRSFTPRDFYTQFILRYREIRSSDRDYWPQPKEEIRHPLPRTRVDKLFSDYDIPPDEKPPEPKLVVSNDKNTEAASEPKELEDLVA